MSNLFILSKENKDNILSLWKQGINAMHLDNDCFERCDKFSIVLPPPNVTGNLHVGHALCVSLQDVFARYYKSQSKEVVWIPGTDHAGIATQSVVVQKLKSERPGEEIPKDEILENIWKWKESNEKTIINQINSFGTICNWNYYRFTMDKAYSKSVNEAFKRLFDAGLIYKGSYLVNWDVVYKTAISDDELEYEDRQTKLYTIKYDIQNSEDSVSVATTRPETILGDVAIAYHPEDDKYKNLRDSFAINPLTGALIPFVSDTSVKQDFGTGLVKITPAHDRFDYELAKRHGLEVKSITDKSLNVIDGFGNFSGKSLIACREIAISELESCSAIINIESYTGRVAISYRSKMPIETLISEQWFVNVSPFKDMLINLLNKNEIDIAPKMHVKSYINWINSLEDWCISRQIVWGHRIPVYINSRTGEKKVFCDGSDKFFENHDRNCWEQETDVLDTWFSSALWPFAVFGWPNKSKELENWYPISMMITGHDIIFFWVTRMLMLGLFLTGKVPFKKILLHGLLFAKSYWRIVDGNVSYIKGIAREGYELNENSIPEDVKHKWEKISKSKGNTIDPLKVCESFGEDSMRIGMISSSYLVPQIDIATSKFEFGKKITTKIWNAYKFISKNIESHDINDKETFNSFEDISFWASRKMVECENNMHNNVEKMDLSGAFNNIYIMFVNVFCDTYLEYLKFSLKNDCVSLSRSNLVYAVKLFIEILVRMHPFAPFITEFIYQEIINNPVYSKYMNTNTVMDFVLTKSILSYESCMLVKVRKEFDVSIFELGHGSDFDVAYSVAASVRSVRGIMRIPTNKKVDVYIETLDRVSENMTSAISSAVLSLSVGKTVSIDKHFNLQSFGSEVVKGMKVCVQIPDDMIDDEIFRLDREIKSIDKKILRLSNRLDSENFVNRATKEVVENSRIELQSLENTKQSLIVSRESIVK